MKRTLLVAAAVLSLLQGCAVVPGPGVVGNGRFLQIYSGTQVVWEMDVIAAGHMNCANQAAMVINRNPTKPEVVKCSHAPAAGLNYSYTAHNRSTESDGFRFSSPYTVRVLSTGLCSTSLAAEKSSEKVVILEDHCTR
jgi:hypothetical protein